MQLRPMTNGRISGTGTVSFAYAATGGMLGGVLISTDGTNAAVVVIRKLTASGDVVFDMSSITAQMVIVPVHTDNVAALYYSITGTGAAAMLYEWVN